MPRGKPNISEAPVELAGKLIDALSRERVVPRFVDSYVEENQRYGLQVHAALYRDLIGLLQREALIAMTVRAFEVTVDPPPAPRGKPKPYCLPKKDVATFRRKFLTALTRQQKWGMGEALDFQRDLQMYEVTDRTKRKLTPAQGVRSLEPSLRGSLRLPPRFILHGKGAHGSESRADRSGKSERQSDERSFRGNGPQE